jgi:hypothetical protein
LDFLGVLKTLADYLQKAGCRFAVIGAHALHSYGLSRATGDLDLIVEAECQPRIIDFLESLGYETLQASSGYSNHIHPLPGMGRIDFVYVTGESASLIFGGASRTLSLDNASITIAVPKPEHLIAMKLFAMKNDPSRVYQDMADIQYLLTLPGIDKEETNQYFEKYGFGKLYEELQK